MAKSDKEYRTKMYSGRLLPPYTRSYTDSRPIQIVLGNCRELHSNNTLKSCANKTLLRKSERFLLKFLSTDIDFMSPLHQNKIHILIHPLFRISPSKS